MDSCFASRNDKLHMKKLLTITIFLLGLTLFVQPVNAQQYPIHELGDCTNAQSCYLYCQIPEKSPTCWSYGRFILHKAVLGEQTTSITFPIIELGNCGSMQACKEYCNQPANHDACTAFGTKKGLLKGTNKENILQLAKEKLGCTNQASCKTFCSDASNQEKCTEFARAVGLARAATVARSSRPQELLQKAKQELGCDSQDTCKQFCSQTDNQEKCKAFAQKISNMRPSGMPAKHGHGGGAMNSMTTYGRSASTGAIWQMKTPCKENECMNWCQQNPSKCPGFPEQKPTGMLRPRPSNLPQQMPPQEGTMNPTNMNQSMPEKEPMEQSNDSPGMQP